MRKILFGSLFLIVMALSFGCMTVGRNEPRPELPSKYLGTYVVADLDPKSENFGLTIKITIKMRDTEKLSDPRYTIAFDPFNPQNETAPYERPLYTSHPWIPAPGTVNSYKLDETTIDCEIPWDEDTAKAVHFEEKEVGPAPRMEGLPLAETPSGQNIYCRIGNKNNSWDDILFYKVTAFEEQSASEISRLLLAEIQKKQEELRTAQERLREETIQAVTDRYAGKIVYVIPTGIYGPKWSTPQPYRGELLADGSTIRFTTTGSHPVAKSTIFLLSWDEDAPVDENQLMSQFMTTMSSRENGLQPPRPTVYLDGETSLAYGEVEEISGTIKNILLTHNLTASHVANLVDYSRSYSTTTSGFFFVSPE